MEEDPQEKRTAARRSKPRGPEAGGSRLAVEISRVAELELASNREQDRSRNLRAESSQTSQRRAAEERTR